LRREEHGAPEHPGFTGKHLFLRFWGHATLGGIVLQSLDSRKESGMITDTSTLISKVKELGPWFHQIEVAEGVRTRDIAPSPGPQPRDHPLDRWIILEKVIPRDLSGLRILDIGCAEGFFAIEMARRGAQVVAVDAAPQYIARLNWLIAHFGLANITTRVATIESMAEANERFDFVLMIALLYHLRSPQLGLDIVSKFTNTLYLESLLHDSNDNSYLYLRQPVEGVQFMPKWIPTEKCILDMLAFAGFSNTTILGRPANLQNRGLYLARH
jgi:tRNA (mo5U34)-methyltransferase